MKLDTNHNPNAGEGKMHYSSGGAENTADSAGVQDGLSSLESIDVKNAEMVSQNQRPEGRTETVGPYKLGC